MMRIKRARAGSGPVNHFVPRASPYALGAVSERLKGPHWKCGVRVTAPRVRIPPAPFVIRLRLGLLR